MSKWMLTALLGISAAAYALPWDVDMADSQAVKGYEGVNPDVDWRLRELPEGVVRQENLLTPGQVARNYDRLTPEGQALRAPFAFDDASLARGEKMYQIYCTPCHGDGEVLGPVARTDRIAVVVPVKSGAVQSRSDGYLYLTIRNGGALMPGYGWAMDDTEMWSLVHYLRELNRSE